MVREYLILDIFAHRFHHDPTASAQSIEWLTFKDVTQSTPQSERRRALRAAASFPVNLSSDTLAEPGLLRDISEIGMACHAPAPIDEMTLVGIEFALPGQTDRHTVTGAVVRCDRIAANDGKPLWDIAIYFTEISPVTKASLRYYVSKGTIV